MNIRDSYVKDHKDHIEKVQSWIDESDWIPDIPDDWSIYHSGGFFSSSEVRIHIPFDRKMYPIVEEYFNSIGWECTERHLDESKLDEYTPWTWMTFSNEGKSWGKVVMVRFDPWADKAVCRRKQVGMTTKEVPVYEFACE